MENSVGSTIKKIKLQEQDKEAKLKEKREHDLMVTSIQRAIREVTAQMHKLSEECVELSRTTDSLEARALVERARKHALSQQIDACYKELDELRRKSEKGISEVWTIRSSMSEAVHSTSDECDIWALLMKPKATDLLPKFSKNKPDNIEQDLLQESKLKAAIERREKILAQRERLMAEPEVGEEFIRIKNALRYSAEMSENLRK